MAGRSGPLGTREDGFRNALTPHRGRVPPVRLREPAPTMWRQSLAHSVCPLTPSSTLVIRMTMTTLMALAEAKARLSEVVSRVSGQHERVTVTVHGTPAAVLLAPEDLESLEETLAILSDPETMRRMAASDGELTEGVGESEADLAAAMKQRRGSLDS